MGRLTQLGALACLYLGAESKALRWQDDTPSWVPPKQTIAAMNMEELGFSPSPTAAPDPANVELKLVKRVRGDDTCGYISGISTDSIYCQTGTCVINSFLSVAGCCASSAVSDCKIASACLPSSSSRLYSSADTLMLYCSSSARPECMTYVYSGSLFNRYTLFGCATSEQRIVVYANPTDTSAVNKATTSGSETSDVASATNTDTATGTDTGTLSPASSTGASRGSVGGGGGGGSSPPVGAIVGGVVGGLALIALIVFGIIFLLRKKKKDPAANNHAAPVTYNGPPPPQQGQPQMYQQPAAPPMQQPSPGGYGPPPPHGGDYPQGFAPVDNRQSMLKQPYDVTMGSYQQTGVSPPASPPPMSPSPTYQSGIPQYEATQNGVSPTYPPQQQQQPQPPQQGGYYNAPPPPAQGQQAPPQQHYQQSGFSSELPAHRGDGELRELA